MEVWILIYILPASGRGFAFANKVIKCAAYGVAQGRGVGVWVDGWAEREGKGGDAGLALL